MKQATGAQAKVGPGPNRAEPAQSSDVHREYPTLKELKQMSHEDFEAWWRTVTASEDEVRGWMRSVGLKSLSDLGISGE
jgi:hypothetical protein